jgi:3-hydroxyacyl-CoA dehydrogenase, NAD binding domain/3-hydroxyacyl-CoA dehydrogenase, C-terminal domain
MLLVRQGGIDIMANATKRPQDVAGTHFFTPANVMKLFEVVKGAKSAPDTLATAMDLGRKIGKISAIAGNCDGFVANRSRGPFGTEMNIMVKEGVLPEQVDKAMVDFGYPIGPFAPPISRVSTSAMRAVSAALPRTPTTAKCRSPTWSSKWDGSAKKPEPAGSATRKVTAPRIPTPNSRA